jgi:hypothetical protein
VVKILSKFSHFYAILIEYDEIQIADIFFREVLRLDGLSRNIVRDRDSRFLGTFWRKLF